MYGDAAIIGNVCMLDSCSLRPIDVKDEGTNLPLVPQRDVCPENGTSFQFNLPACMEESDMLV